MGEPRLKTAPAAAAGANTQRLREQVDARLEPAMHARLRALLWQDRLTSLWAPVSIFGLAFLLYLFVVELHTPSYVWAQPLLKGFGLLTLVAFVALWVGRAVLRRAFELRTLRSAAREQEDELLELGDRHAGRMEPGLLQELVERTASLEAAMVSRDLDRLNAELQAYGELSEKKLAGFRRHGALYFTSGLMKALAVALVIRTLFLEPFKIPSGSMIPTLEIGDQIFVNKFIYGVRVPFTNWVPFVIVRKPARGDVIVFNNPLDGSKDFIKRVIGVPGDRVEVRDERLYLNGVLQDRALVEPSYVYNHRDEGGPWQSQLASLYRESLDGRVHPILQNPDSNAGDTPPFVVPEGTVFVMGDNRENSADGRTGFGISHRVEFVPYGNIKGKAMVIWLSLSRDGLFSGWTGGTGLRTDRFFTPVR